MKFQDFKNTMYTKYLQTVQHVIHKPSDVQSQEGVKGRLKCVNWPDVAYGHRSLTDDVNVQFMT